MSYTFPENFLDDLLCQAKKPTSTKPSDKRKLSLLNSDFKVFTSIEAKRLGKAITHTLSKSQYAAGDDSGIYHRINLVWDAVQSVSGNKGGVGILDNDYEIAFDEW